MTTIDNSKIFLGGIFTDAEVKVAANTTYYAGTILGRNVSGDLVAFSSDNNVEASGDDPAFNTAPLYILAQDIANATGSAVTTMCRVYECGEIDASKVIFVKAADKTTENYDALKTNGYTLVNVQRLAE